MRILHYPSDLRSLAFILGALGLMALQWADVLRHPALFAATLALAFIACVINHNHQHHPTFRSAPLNQAFGILITLAIGVPASAIIPMHNMNHHAHNNRDEDFVRASRVLLPFRLLTLILFPFGVMIGYARHKKTELRTWKESRPALFRKLVFERVALTAIVPAMLLTAPLATLVYVLLPYAFGQWGILAINHIQHVGCDPESRFNHSRNILGRWINWWVFNNGFHTAHHLRPELHWSRLPALHEEIRASIDPRLNRRSLAGTVFELYVRPERTPNAGAVGIEEATS